MIGRRSNSKRASECVDRRHGMRAPGLTVRNMSERGRQPGESTVSRPEYHPACLMGLDRAATAPATTVNVAVIVLNWNRLEDTRRCIASLPADDPAWVAYVVNNGCRPEERLSSNDGRPGRVLVLDLPTNQGFTGGVNHAARRALSDGHEWLLLLNNDAVLAPGALAALRQARGPSIGALCPAIVTEGTGLVSALGSSIDWKRGLTRDRHHGESVADLPLRPDSVDFGTGAGLLLSAEAVRRIGLLDETYFAYWEETDWCTRAKRSGFMIRTCPEAMVVHRGGASLDPASRLYLMVRNCLTFMRRHAPRRSFVTFLPVFILWTVPVWSARPARKSPARTLIAVGRALGWHLRRPRLPPPRTDLEA